MEVALDKRYAVAASVEQAWAVLCDIRATAGCMPGASITEQVDATHFKGQVKSKVGPAVMSFGGDIDVLGIDETARQLRMVGKGSDKSGSSASMDLTAHLEAGETPASCVLVGHAAIIVNGKLAQFGSRLLVPVADMMLAQFAKNFEASAASVPAAVSAAEPAAAVEPLRTVGAAPPAPPAVPAAPAVTATASAVPVAASVAAAPRKPAPALQPANELNVLAFGWAVFKGWLGGLFGKRA